MRKQRFKDFDPWANIAYGYLCAALGGFLFASTWWMGVILWVLSLAFLALGIWGLFWRWEADVMSARYDATKALWDAIEGDAS